LTADDPSTLRSRLSAGTLSGGGLLRAAQTPTEETALDSLIGLSVGDALGAPWEGAPVDASRIDALAPPAGIAPWTDDTQMAISVVEVLLQAGLIDPDRLARAFAERYQAWRGYGRGMHVLLAALREGQPWRAVRTSVFPDGSYGNGSAMRVAPLGAFLADHPRDTVIEQAALSAEVTHAHPEGIAGAVAVALAAWMTARNRGTVAPTPTALLHGIADVMDAGRETTRGIRAAGTLPGDTAVTDAVDRLGNGRRVSCQDTVPLALWLAAHHLDRYDTAVRWAVAAGGDADTLAAIVGGIVAARAGRDAIPSAWSDAVEPLPLE
jgi:ADP-ribosylglycohydrolase